MIKLLCRDGFLFRENPPPTGGVGLLAENFLHNVLELCGNPISEIYGYEIEDSFGVAFVPGNFLPGKCRRSGALLLTSVQFPISRQYNALLASRCHRILTIPLERMIVRLQYESCWRLLHEIKTMW